MSNFTESIEKQEIIQKLIDNGYGELVEVLLMRESEVYTKRKCYAPSISNN
jgi:hypothetical protein